MSTNISCIFSRVPILGVVGNQQGGLSHFGGGANNRGRGLPPLRKGKARSESLRDGPFSPRLVDTGFTHLSDMKHLTSFILLRQVILT